MIVVNDGSTDDTLEQLVDELDLVPVEAVSRGIVETEQIVERTTARRRTRGSSWSTRVNGGKADALNAGLNHSRYRYICGVDADMVFARDALSRAMREIAADPRTSWG